MRAVVLDTDGVITDSARAHAAAWKQSFDTYLDRHPPSGGEHRPFDVRTDYLRYVDGKSRRDGAASFLAARGLPVDEETVATVCRRKERLFVERLRRGDIPAYPGTVRLLRALRAAGVRLAAASASHHARELLTHAGVLDLFAVLADGAEAARLGLPGKPDPALFLEAARRLGEPLARTAVVEDSLAGVDAGRRGRTRKRTGSPPTAASSPPTGNGSTSARRAGARDALRGRQGPHPARPGRSCGAGRSWRFRVSRGGFCDCTSCTCCRPSPRTPRTSTPGCPPADCTARPTGAMCSGTNCSSCPV